MQQGSKATEIISVGNLIISVIKAHIAGEEISLPADVDFNKLYILSEKHKVTPLVAKAVIDSEFPTAEVKSAFKKELFRASMRYETQCKEKDELTQIFAEQGIMHCFLKGQKVSRFYKNPEERYMLDMDIFIEESKMSQAEEILSGRGYARNSYGDDKDVGYIKKPFLNIELHRNLKYDYDKGYDYYKGAFERLVAEENGYTLNMTNEDFYVYILSHSAHHFETSGTGIRNVLDHYYLNKKLKPICNGALLEKKLNEIGLSVFCKKLDALAEHWFGEGEYSEDIGEIERFVFLSGVFGNETNGYLSAILKGKYTDKKSSYIISRLFPSAKNLSPRYPLLKKYPFLLPVFWLVRLLSAIFKKTDVAGELQGFDAAITENQDEFKTFMNKNGL